MNKVRTQKLGMRGSREVWEATHAEYPGCVAQGPTPDEAVTLLNEMMAATEAVSLMHRGVSISVSTAPARMKWAETARLAKTVTVPSMPAHPAFC